MTKKEIKRLYKEEKNKAKNNYKKHLADAEEAYQDRLDAFYREGGKKRPIDPPKRPLLEEIGNAITHGVGAVFSLVALVLMLLSADTPIELVSAVIYFFGLFVMFMSSCLYHAFIHGSGVKRLFYRFDYSAIYLLIGATFTPILLCFFADLFGIIFFAAQWAVIACGISLVGVFGPKKLSFVHIPLYVILGWSALILLPRMIGMNFSLFLWILIGGVFYTCGIPSLLINKRASHFLWHFFVLAGAIVQWIGIYIHIFLN